MKCLIKTLILSSLANLWSQLAYALPEFSRYGYFSCTSCHVSSGGGGLLTLYGRSFSAEKLATWTKKNEGNLLHGLIKKPSEHFLVGANFRQLQAYESSARRHRGRWFPMQRQLQAGFVSEKFGVVADTNIDDSQVNPAHDKTSLSSYEHYAFFNPKDSMQIRAGRFFPRYGLMIPQHPSYIRDGLGFSPGTETYNGEFAYFSEFNEIIASYIFAQGGGPLNGGSEVEKKLTSTSGLAFSYSHFTKKNHRLTVSVLQKNWEENTRTLLGASATFNLPQNFGLMQEVDLAYLTTDGIKSDKTVYYTKLFNEVWRGLFPGIVFERNKTNTTESTILEDKLGLLAQWHPRPHFEFEVYVGGKVTRPSFEYTDTAYAMFHYYL